jgi:hypothetical protein
MKTEREAKAIREFCRHLSIGLQELGYDVTFDYDNETETIVTTMPYQKVRVNVNMSSTKAVLIDVVNQLTPYLYGEK